MPYPPLAPEAATVCSNHVTLFSTPDMIKGIAVALLSRQIEPPTLVLFAKPSPATPLSASRPIDKAVLSSIVTPLFGSIQPLQPSLPAIHPESDLNYPESSHCHIHLGASILFISFFWPNFSNFSSGTTAGDKKLCRSFDGTFRKNKKPRADFRTHRSTSRSGSQWIRVGARARQLLNSV
jgi:hypothetical protein